jgi:D-psicose/D-tagatose/L-ribulose 3-epimerase
MNIGFNLLLWTTHFVEDQFPILGKLKSTGYDGVEIPLFDVSNPDHFKKIGAALKENGLRSTAVTVCPDEEHSCISPDKANRQGALDNLKRVIDCGHNAGIELLCGPYYQVLGNFSGAYPSPDELERAAEVHRPLAEYAQAAGIKLAIESLNRFEAHLLNTIAQAKSYVHLVNHPNFGTMFDTFHANIEEKDPMSVLKNNLDVICHFHISENDRGTPGSGHAPIKEALTILKEANYKGWATIEAFGGMLPDLAAATRVWRDFFPNVEDVYENGFAYVKKCLA